MAKSYTIKEVYTINPEEIREKFFMLSEDLSEILKDRSKPLDQTFMFKHMLFLDYSRHLRGIIF